MGASLASTLYELPLTIGLIGELGAGKTAFLQGFAGAIGIREQLTSPTYALEQLYECPRCELLHIDLYRLAQRQAENLLSGSENFSGIRCIEWFDRAYMNIPGHAQLHSQDRAPLILIEMSEAAPAERCLDFRFHDIVLPTCDQICEWRRSVMLPGHIAEHCEAVAEFAAKLGGVLVGNGKVVRRLALCRAAQAHDLFRFLDFRPGGHPRSDYPSETLSEWAKIRARYHGMHHEQACAEFLDEHGFAALSAIVAVHGLDRPPPLSATIEQKILFYADKRVMCERVVSLEERFADFARRYGNGAVSGEAKRWYAITRQIEESLFPQGPPF
ncbi:tRNA (adenosine(37)-N6)-threonylcarbamoyltransferase complex ATPase subunit type 1 TsaE [Candidatus Peregrinibacteria bacterium]|nr:tRNA (adenosine(37)-N6)-threonylcarbamoyltransferase complex ATPase subunit type 1 TsaE [Candidatus Peregrinibacteria bacterium]